MDRLWYVLEVRRDGMGTEVVEGRLRNFYDPKDVQVNAKAFEKMNNLWLLHLDYVHLTAGYEHISRRLLWLSWKGFPLDCIPCNFSMKKLVALDLRYSSLKKVWNGNMILDNLKFLYLSHCHCLTRTPDFYGLNSLEELLLNDCKSLVEVDESIRCLNKLLVLDMKNCTKLRKLPSCIWMLKSLKRLDLSGCSKLGNFAEFKGQLHKLWGLFFSSWTLPTKGVSSIGFPLTPVQASGCLTELNLKNCHLSYLPGEIGNLISLRTLDLTKNKLSILPDSICNLICLKRLHLDDNNLSHLPSGIGRLTSLEVLYLPRNSLCTLPDTIDGLVSLCVLDIEENNICTIPDSVINIRSLTQIRLNNCAKLRSLPKLPTWCYVDALCCPSLESLPLELDHLGMAVIFPDSNKLAENNYLTSLLKQLPKTKGLSKLRHAINIAVLAGDEEVRIWFPYHDGRGPNVSFVMPPSPSVKKKLLGWILRVLFRCPREAPYNRRRFLIREVICNKIKKLVHVFYVNVVPSEVDRVCLVYIPQGYFGLQLQGGDEVEIPIIANLETLVMNWAIDLIYEEEADEIHKATDTLYQVKSI